MIKRSGLCIALCASVGLFGCTAEPPASPQAAQTAGRECFRASQVNGFSPVSDNIIDVQVGANRYYRLSLMGMCPNSVWTHRVALRTTGGGQWICQGLDAEIIVADPSAPERCLVSNVQPITKADWDAGQHHH